jgi:coatomer subunit beta'
MNLITISNSQASKTIDAWKADLISKKCPGFAASLAHPDMNPELFEEG